MKPKLSLPLLLAILCVLFLPACRAGGGGSRTPTVDSPQTTRPGAALESLRTRQAARTASPQPPTASATRTPTRTPTPAPTATPTPSPTPAPQINLVIVTCDTGIDLFNRLGEVTNGYVLIQNVGQVDIQDLQVTLSANDVERTHPDSVFQIQNLPAMREIALKLTVDTSSTEETVLTALLAAAPGVELSAQKSGCQRRIADRQALDALGELFTVRETTP